MSDNARGRKPGYFQAAFANVYNLTLLAGTSVASLATGEWWLLGVGAAAEAMWLLFATDDARFRRAVDARHREQERLETIRRMQEQAALLPSEERQRVQLLGARAAEIKAETQRNPRIAGDFMQEQLHRLDDLVAEFVGLSLTASRCESYLRRSDARQINRERDAQRKLAETAADEGTRQIALQNQAILEKRLGIIEELGRFVARARGQMSLIENTISLLRDQVMTMATPEALTVQLDSLVASVEAMREAAKEAELMVTGPSFAGAVGEAGAPALEGESAAAGRERVRG